MRYPSGGPHRGAHLVYSSTGTSKTGSSTFTTGTVGGDVIGTSSLDLAVLRNADNLNRLLDGISSGECRPANQKRLAELCQTGRARGTGGSD